MTTTESGAPADVTVQPEPAVAPSPIASSAVKKSPTVMSVRMRLGIIAAYLVLIVALVDGSFMRGIGDSGEYYMMADKIAHLHRPEVAQSDFAKYKQDFSNIGGYMGLGVAYKVGDPGPYQMNHFWAYSAITAPVLRVTDALHFNPVRAFTFVNVAFLLTALFVVLGRVHWMPTMLVFAGPVFWWVDKMHTETFTFSLLAMAFVLTRSNPRWAMVLAGLAATQNFPIGFLVGAIAVYSLIKDRSIIKSVSAWASLVVAGLLTISSLAYYQLTIGTTSPQSLNGGVDPAFPTFQQYVAPLVDLNIGLAIGAPIIVLTTLAALAVIVWQFRRTDWFYVALLACTAAFFLFGFSQTGNFNHGATPSMSRYGLWLLPICLAVLAEAARVSPIPKHFPVSRLRISTSTLFGGVIALSAIVSIVSFAPKITDGLHRPTPLANWVWTNHPDWNNPIVEVFWERTQSEEGSAQPTATPNCSKALVVRGQWPSQCGSNPPPIPTTCQLPANSACYANRKENGAFTFVPVSGVPGVDTRPVAVGDIESRLKADGVSQEQ